MIWWSYPAIRAMSSCTHHYYSEGPVQRNSHMRLLVHWRRWFTFHRETKIHDTLSTSRLQKKHVFMASNVRVVMRMGGFSQDQ